MTIETDLNTVLTGLSGKFFPEGDVPTNIGDAKFITYRRTLYEPVMALGGPYGLIHSEFAIECWGTKTDTVQAKASSLSLAAEVRAAIEGSATLLAANRFELANSGDQYESEVLAVMEPVFYSFHTSS